MAWENGIQVPFPLFFFAWHWKTDLNFVFRFSLSHHFEKRKRVSFWFRFSFSHHFENGFEFRFSFSHYFEKRIWISFLVFASLWKTDLNFVFRFCMACYWKIDLNFVCHFSMTWKTDYCTGPVIWSPRTSLKVDRGIHFLCKWKQVNFSLPGAEVSDELLPPTRYSLF